MTLFTAGFSPDLGPERGTNHLKVSLALPKRKPPCIRPLQSSAQQPLLRSRLEMYGKGEYWYSNPAKRLYPLPVKGAQRGNDLSVGFEGSNRCQLIIFHEADVTSYRQHT